MAMKSQAFWTLAQARRSSHAQVGRYRQRQIGHAGWDAGVEANKDRGLNTSFLGHADALCWLYASIHPSHKGTAVADDIPVFDPASAFPPLVPIRGASSLCRDFNRTSIQVPWLNTPQIGVELPPNKGDTCRCGKRSDVGRGECNGKVTMWEMMSMADSGTVDETTMGLPELRPSLLNHIRFYMQYGDGGYIYSRAYTGSLAFPSNQLVVNGYAFGCSYDTAIGFFSSMMAAIFGMDWQVWYSDLT